MSVMTHIQPNTMEVLLSSIFYLFIYPFSWNFTNHTVHCESATTHFTFSSFV